MILALVASVALGAAVSLPLFQAGRGLNPARLERLERSVAFTLFPLLLLGAFWVVSRLYAPGYLRVLGVVVALPILGTLLVALRRSGSLWRRLPQLAAGLTLVAVAASESLLASAVAGGIPARYPALVAQVGGPRAIPALGTALQTGDTEVRTQAVEELVKFGAAAAPYLGAALTDRDPAVRTAAAPVAAKSPLPEQKAAWCALLRDPNRANRQTAVSALYRLKDGSTIPAVFAALAEQTEMSERQNLLNLLQTLGQSDGRAMLELAKSDDPNIRLLVAESLGKVGNGPAALALIRMAASDSDARVRASAYAAAAAAAATTRKDETHRLIELEHGIPVISSSPGYVDPALVLKALIVGTRDPEPVVREAAVTGIGEVLRAPESSMNNYQLDLRDRDNGLTPLDLGPAQLALTQRLSDPDEGVRASAAGAFGKEVSPAAVPALIQALSRAPARRMVAGVTMANVRSTDPLQYLSQALVAARDPRAIPALAARDATYTPINSCSLCEALYRLGAPERVRHHVVIRREQ